ncbi:hypothetical protein [Xanthomonas sp. 1678]|uniref:hypothetical protein n=1 Tax=Xanthomonas sp. 1678 TaxID=3158788 RepID=UPI00286724BF|nr:hypothetical protein [Xanthomonas translucens]
MSGFLQRLVERVQGPAHAALRRRRPSVFEAREAAPSSPMAFDAGLPAPVPTPPGGGEAYVVHRHDIHHHDRPDAPVALRAPRAESPTTPAPKGAHPTQPTLPAPPSLRPLPASSAARHNVVTVAASDQTPVPTVRRPRRETEDTAPAPSAPHAQPAAEAVDPTPLRRARPAPTQSAPPVPEVPTLPLPPRLPATQRVAAPVAHPARRAALPAATETSVQVTIGSVEIRAHAPAPASQRPSSRPAASATAPSLEAYLRQRHGGPR